MLPYLMILVIDILVRGFGADMATINISQKIVDTFISHGEKDYPHECCGFILGQFKDEGSFGVEYIPASNVKEENRERRFLIDPLAYQKAEDEADERDMSVISIVHSHPDHPAKPSDFDLDHAWPGFSYIIISVKLGRTTGYRSWQLNEDRSFFVEENINIIEKEK